MFEALLKTKFQNKCKSLIKLTKARLELIKRKRNAMQKYLKADIADLLTNNLDFDAHSRAEGYLVELNLSSCYDFIEKSCGCISNQLSVMSKESECPEECKEAVSTLMFAAARFADLPELRELRSLFTKRYGNSVELYVNKEFVAMLKSPPPSKDMKFQLMQEIAHESGLEWSSKALEQKLYKPPAPERDGSKNITDSRYMQNKPRDTTVGTKRGFTSNGLEKVIDDGNQLHNTWKSPTIDHKQDASTNREGKNSSYSSTSSSEEENNNDDKGQLKYSAIPPPYTRPNVSKTDSSPAVRPIVSDTEMVAQKKLNEDREKESKPKEKPRSVRSRPLKPPAGNEKVGFAKGDVKEKKKALEGKKKETGEEEKMMDRLLMHYSNKAEAKQHTGPEYSRRTRAASLPIEPTGPLEVEAPARALSFQQNLSNTEQGQPKLLDYDDFVARLAALRGEGK